MDRSYDISFSSYEDLSINNSTRKGDISISEQLSGFARLRVSALTKAAEMSPLVKEVTIGPNSPIKKDEIKEPVTIIPEDKDEDNLIEDKLREDLRYTLIMKECENKLQESSEELFESLVENMITKRAEFITKFWTRQSEECNRRALQFKARKLQMLKELQENDNLSVLNRARQDEQNCQIINTQTIDNMNRILEEQNRATARFAAITDSHYKIWVCYSEITNIVKIEPLAKAICDKYTTVINTVMGNIDHIMEISKTGSVTDKDVKQAEVLVLNIENIKRKILESIDTIKREENLKKQKEEEEIIKKRDQEREAQELKAAQIAAAAEAEKTRLQQQPQKTQPVFYSAENYNYYENLKNYLEQYEAQYAQLLQDVNFKKFRFDCQKAVNTPVNALSSVSASHMRDKYDKLSKLLKGERVQVLDIYVTATQHPQGLFYCTALLAKKIVRQGDLLVSSNTEAAYPLAAVTAALWAQFPHLGKLVEANFHRYCPYLVPMFLPQKEGQSDKEFYMSRGYTYNDEGVVEKQDKFLKRMSGIFRLRCAIWIASMPKFMNTTNPHGLRFGWQWLASFLNLKPEPDISATLVHDFFIMCGSKFDKHYGKQFRKILELTSEQYLKVLENIDEGGPKTRLEVYLQTVLKSNVVPAPPATTQINW
ncbi:hypothetical protein PYW07_007740 [Mythimna separata]|uniref:mRNA export factor GLE1 n=1 Tax=Mythimna separata TaxID=271217 RepID=A0AAD7YNY2_MYTSE|nr:hypothetical protein PYW07_007740 [Mythimna separata]